jgi:hypothetical protein
VSVVGIDVRKRDAAGTADYSWQCIADESSPLVVDLLVPRQSRGGRHPDGAIAVGERTLRSRRARSESTLLRSMSSADAVFAMHHDGHRCGSILGMWT